MDPASPLSVGMLGMYGALYANMAVHECDCLMAVGARFDDRVTGRLDGFAPKARIIHIDIDPSSIRKVVKAALPIVGDAKAALAALIELVEPRDRGAWLAQIGTWREEVAPAPAAARRHRPARDHGGDGRRRRHGADRRLRCRSVADVDGQLLRLRRAAPLHHQRRSGDHGLCPAGGHGGGPRQPGADGLRHRRRRRLPDECPGTRHLRPLRHPGQVGWCSTTASWGWCASSRTSS